MLPAIPIPTMVRTVFVLVAWMLAYLSTAAQLQPCATSLQPPSSGFKIKNAGMYTEGTFAKAEFSITQIGRAFSITASADVKSLDTGIGMRDNHLRSADYFNAEKYPRITFVSSSIVADPSNPQKFTVTGMLTIKEVSKNIAIPMIVKREGGNMVYSTNFTIDRTAYGVGKNHWTLSNEVRIALAFSCPAS